MTPAQIGELALLRSELNALWLKADALARRLQISGEKPGAECVREVLAHISIGESTLQFAIDMQRHERGTPA